MVKMKVRKGVTLVELLITIAILSIILIPLSNMAITSLKISVSASDEQKASNLAQKHMEKLKSEDAAIIIGYVTNPQSLNEDGFNIEYSVSEVSDYEFSDVTEAESSDENIDDDYKIKVNNGELSFIDKNSVGEVEKEKVRFSDTIPEIKITKKDTSSEKVVIFEAGTASVSIPETKNDVKIRVDINTRIDSPKELKIIADNQDDDKNSILTFYFIKSSTVESKPNIKLEKEAGKSKSYYNIFNQDASTKSDANARLYEIEVTVKKDGKTITTNKSYKTFYE